MDFFSLQNKTLVIIMGLLLIVSWGFGIFQYGLNHKWAAMDFARSSAYEYDSAECERWFSAGQANLSLFYQLGHCTQDIDSWTPTCRENFSAFQENMGLWFDKCSYDVERRIK